MSPFGSSGPSSAADGSGLRRPASAGSLTGILNRTMMPPPLSHGDTYHLLPTDPNIQSIEALQQCITTEGGQSYTQLQSRPGPSQGSTSTSQQPFLSAYQLVQKDLMSPASVPPHLQAGLYASYQQALQQQQPPTQQQSAESDTNVVTSEHSQSGPSDRESGRSDRESGRSDRESGRSSPERQ